MSIFTTIYSLIKSFVEFLSCKHKFSYDNLNSNEIDDESIDHYEVSDNYESIIFNQMVENIHS
jgi:hypothetical protein